MFGVVWDYYNSKLKGKQYKQNISPKSYKPEIKILANPGLAYRALNNPAQGDTVVLKRKLSPFCDIRFLHRDTRFPSQENWLRQEMVIYFWVVLQFTFGSSREDTSFYRWGTYFFLNIHIWMSYNTYM